MSIFVLIGRDGAASPELRARVRPDHLAHLEPLSAEGRVCYAGPLLDARGAPVGSVIVFEADDLAAARALAGRDPYVQRGVFASYEIFESKQVFPQRDTGSPRSPAGASDQARDLHPPSASSRSSMARATRRRS